MPTLSTEKTALELQYEQMREQVRIEKSKLSDFELEELDFESMKKARIKKAQEEDSNIKVRFCVAKRLEFGTLWCVFATEKDNLNPALRV